MEADPNCADCKGSGKITLLIKTVDCRCLDRKPSDEIVIREEDFENITDVFKKNLRDNYPDWRGGI
jgi:hypothetical protein